MVRFWIRSLPLWTLQLRLRTPTTLCLQTGYSTQLFFQTLLFFNIFNCPSQDEREKIPDPEASKPEDWDESAPQKILDESAEKPSGWLDEEPDMIADPDAVRPEDWDDEMDGEIL